MTYGLFGTVSRRQRPDSWSLDHWNVLNYVGGVVDTCGHFQIGLDARMRTNRQMHDMLKSCKKPERSSWEPSFHEPYPCAVDTKLQDNVIVRGHDDWNCFEDMVHAGLFADLATALPAELRSLNAGDRVVFSSLGWLYRDGLSEHRRAGRFMSHFRPPDPMALAA